jgi:hypothetical protein
LSLTVKPSLQGRFALVWSGDPSLQPRPVDLPDDAPPDAVEQRKTAQAEYDHALTVCRETGNWSAMVKPGDVPTVFIFELPSGEDRRAVNDEFWANAKAQRAQVAASRLFRVALKDVTNWPGSAPPLSFVKENGLDYASGDIVKFLDDRVHPSVVGELGSLVYARLQESIPGK